VAVDHVFHLGIDMRKPALDLSKLSYRSIVKNALAARSRVLLGRAEQGQLLRHRGNHVADGGLRQKHTAADLC
jgi:hypothetical protein